MSKLLAVADSHGCKNPLIIAKQNFDAFDKIVFLGDFFDHDDGTFTQQKEIFNDVMELKKKNPEKVIVLLGNHDANYIIPEMITWQPEHEQEIQKLILKNIKNIDLLYLENKWLFSHAGVSEVWFYNQLISDGFPCDSESLLKNKFNSDFCGQFNNRVHKKDFSLLKFTGITGYGDEITQNPMWIRPDSLMISTISGYNQVVGHSAVSPEERVKTKNNDIFLFLDSFPNYRNVYAQIDTETNFFEIKELKIKGDT